MGKHRKEAETTEITEPLTINPHPVSVRSLPVWKLSLAVGAGLAVLVFAYTAQIAKAVRSGPVAPVTVTPSPIVVTRTAVATPRPIPGPTVYVRVTIPPRTITAPPRIITRSATATATVTKSATATATVTKSVTVTVTATATDFPDEWIPPDGE